jgi:hypothetical protein
MVYDPFIAYYFKEPIGAKLLKDSDARVTIQWDVKGISNGEIGSQTLRYELSYLKGNKTARLRAKLAYGDTHEPTYPASCKREKWN